MSTLFAFLIALGFTGPEHCQRFEDGTIVCYNFDPLPPPPRPPFVLPPRGRRS